ncbi:6-phospho-alpha-glucosidase [Proteiniclasticum ruminis]|uniref:Maltose-6'-phosphate glucosidase n=1 Tax=Proteiniclasticum ruminis TaxID=398199 RepID=A0A1G8JIP8_9CLOT|nr:6-phospho-alpha-glucosidase [Proteiniclasticum ruminis]SDI31036.1 maltose-6'-phosphate glucosidase [Proteiniclasticum ruminis]
MRKNPVITIAGAGSLRIPALIGSLIYYKETLPVEKIILFDIDEERLERVKAYIDLTLKEYYSEAEVLFTTKEEEAYKDTDYVLCNMRVGVDTMRSVDEKIPLKYGLVGQETCGPGGFSYGMRSIGAMIDMVNTVRKYSKDTWILNYTNPAAIVAVALDKVFPEDKRIMNICDQPYSMIKSFAKILGEDMYDLEPRYFGLNHFGWFTSLKNVKTGEELLPKLKDYLMGHEFKPFNAEQRDPSWLKTYKNVNKLMQFFPEYVPNTYLQYYFFAEEIVKDSDPNFTRVDEAKLGREKKVLDILKKAGEQGNLTDIPLMQGEVFGNLMVEVVDSIHNDLNKVFVVIGRNGDLIPNLPEDAMVELASYLGKEGAKMIPYGEVKPFYKGLIEGQYAYEKLTVESYLEKDYTKALQALTLNRSIVDPVKAKLVLDDLMDHSADYWTLEKKEL